MIDVKPYNLPDYEIIESKLPFDVRVWQPDRTYLVLGQSNEADTSLYCDLVIKDEIPVIKRPSGGETVILTPNMLVIAVILSEEKLQNPHIYFDKINTGIMAVINNFGFENVSQKGISDICIGHKKILGSSIYRKSGKVFYHAVLNVAEDIGLISKYIRHPQKEPDYRQGRKHEDFVCSLAKIKADININALKEEIVRSLFGDVD